MSFAYPALSSRQDRRLCLLALVLLLLAAGVAGSVTSLLGVHDESGVALLAVPLEAGEVEVVELVVGLEEKEESALVRAKRTRQAQH